MPKHYAVARGRRTGVFSSWAECEQQVKGFPNARFKSFKSKADATTFVAVAGGAATASSPQQQALPARSSDVARSYARDVRRVRGTDSVRPSKRYRRDHSGAGSAASVQLDASGEIVIVGSATDNPAAAHQLSGAPPASKFTAATKETATAATLCVAAHTSTSTPSPCTNAARPSRRYRLFADGGARGNPGIAGCGYVLLDGGVDGFTTPVESPSDEDGRTVAVGSAWVGARETNNTAEYRGLIRGLSRTIDLASTTKMPLGAASAPVPAAGSTRTGVPGTVALRHGIDIFLDSNLVVEQVRGNWAAKKPHLRALRDEVWRLLQRFDNRRVGSVHPEECQWNIRHVRREHNQRADAQANLAMDRGPPAAGSCGICAVDSSTGDVQGEEDVHHNVDAMIVNSGGGETPTSLYEFLAHNDIARAAVESTDSASSASSTIDITRRVPSYFDYYPRVRRAVDRLLGSTPSREADAERLMLALKHAVLTGREQRLEKELSAVVNEWTGEGTGAGDFAGTNSAIAIDLTGEGVGDAAAGSEEWEWQVDVGAGGWAPFTEAVQRDVEASLAAGDREVEFALHGFMYRLDLTRMLQKNLSTGNVRPVRRVLV